MSDRRDDDRMDNQQPSNPQQPGAGPDQIGEYQHPHPDSTVPRVESEEDRAERERRSVDPRVIPDPEQPQQQEGEEVERTTLDKVLAGEEYDMAKVSELYCPDGTRPVPWSVINAMILHLDGLQAPIDQAREGESDEERQRREDEERNRVG